ncbi:uncharacterized protein [Coffea arabica]|uniref:Dymeclin n=1 Tax=Coffea arabica TaxID=13443 RepID=A0ABM4X8W4_COFAR
MGGVPSTPRWGSAAEMRPAETAEYLIGALVGEKSYPLASDYWQKLLESPLHLRWPSHRVLQASQLFAQNNCKTRHLAKILVHLAWCLQECVSASGVPSAALVRALNALYISSVFLKYFIENAKSDHFEELHLSLDENEAKPTSFSKANFVLLPFNLFVGSSGEATRSPLAENSLNVLLILIHYRKCIETDYVKDRGDHSSEPLPKEDACFSENPYCKALENAQDIEFDRLDVEGNVQNGPLVRLPFASLFDTLGLYLADERSILLLYSMVQGNSAFLEYVLVRTDLDTLLMPMLETLYNASRRTSNQIYMVLIILLILSQDSSFNASIHKLMLPNVPWYQERLLHQTSLGSLMVIILIRTVKYNLSKLRQDVYLHTNCLATLANMAPHVHRLSAYASQRLVSLFDMLARKYNKLAEMSNNKMHMPNGESREEDNLPEDTTAELHIYTDFLRIVLEILNAILTYTLPRNPEVVYAIMHRQEVFQPFRNHPRFNELLENIFTVLDFFNSRMDAQKMDGEWSVEKVLQVIVINCRSWRGEGMKMFTQLRFTYEQESHPEEFFIPYVWQLVLSCSSFSFNPNSINLFPVDLPLEKQDSFVGEDGQKLQSGGLNGLEQQVDVLV